MKAYTQLLNGQNKLVADFVGKALDVDVQSWGTFKTLGFFDTRGLKVGLVYNHFHKPNISMHVAARPGALWCHPSILYHIFMYPFGQLECRRVTAPVRSTNLRSIKLVEALGYKLEGTLRHAGREGEHMLIYGMLKEECRWL